MIIVKFKSMFLIDFIITILLSGMSFLSDFPAQLITIFLLAFMLRTITAFLFFSKEENGDKG